MGKYIPPHLRNKAQNGTDSAPYHPPVTHQGNITSTRGFGGVESQGNAPRLKILSQNTRDGPQPGNVRRQPFVTYVLFVFCRLVSR